MFHLPKIRAIINQTKQTPEPKIIVLTGFHEEQIKEITNKFIINNIMLKVSDL